MSDVNKQIITCPKCGKKIEIETRDSIELPYDHEQKELILKNTFFKVHCDGCNIVFPIAYRCIYNDLEQRYFIWLAPRMDEEEQEAIHEYNDRILNDKVLKLAQAGYRYRIVRNDNEMREKVIIFDNGLDDRYIETMKAIYYPGIRQKLSSDMRIVGIYFEEKQGGGYQWVVITDKKKLMFVEINMDIYADMMDKLKDVVEKNTPKGLVAIDPLWANNVMIEKMGVEQAPIPEMKEADIEE